MKRRLNPNIIFVVFYPILAAFLLFAYFHKLGPRFVKNVDRFFEEAGKYKFETFVERAERLSHDLIMMNRMLIIICLVLVIAGMYHMIVNRRLHKNPSLSSDPVGNGNEAS